MQPQTIQGFLTGAYLIQLQKTDQFQHLWDSCLETGRTRIPINQTFYRYKILKLEWPMVALMFDQWEQNEAYFADDLSYNIPVTFRSNWSHTVKPALKGTSI